MSTENNAPLWLKLKKEYIDANFENVLIYLSKASQASEKDAFYEDTIRLIGERVEDIIAEIVECPLYDNPEDLDVQYLSFQTRLLAAYLLVNKAAAVKSEALLAFLRILSLQDKSHNTQEFFSGIIGVFNGSITSISGFSWTDVLNYQSQLLIHKVLHGLNDGTHESKERIYENHGILTIQEGNIVFYPCSQKDFKYSKKNYSPSIKLADDCIQILSKSEDRLKQSDASDYLKIDKYIHETELTIKHIKPVQVIKKHYADGDVVDVRVVSIGMESIIMETIDSGYEKIVAPLADEPVFYYQYNDYKRYFREGDYLSATLSIAEVTTFSIRNTMCDFIANDYVNTEEELLATVKKIADNKIVWWTKDGYPAYTSPVIPELIVGDCALIKIRNVHSNGYAVAKYIESVDETFDIEESKDLFLYNFTYDKETFVAPEEKKETPTLSRALIRMFCSSLYSYQKSLSSIIERYRYLAVGKILSILTDDAGSLEYISFVSDYLKNLAFFAQGKYNEIKRLVPSPVFADVLSASRKVNTIDVLMNYGNKDEEGILDRAIEDTNSPELARIAKLIQSCNRISDVVSSAMLNSIKREITKSLSVDSENESDLDEDNGIYLGMEDRLHEFKSSFVYPPAGGMSANLNVQSQNIFKGLCAFLNSEIGGTLYLGVSDLGYVIGLENDLNYLKKNHDGYIRLIQDEAKKYFDIDVINHWDFKVLYDGKVVAIQVRPYEIGVVEFNGKAYIRLTGENVEMSETYRKQLLSKRVFVDNDKASNLSNIQTAIREHKVAIFHNYASSNSGIISDRRVEPFSVNRHGTTVWCYDIEADINKVFSISRIDFVEITENGWSNTFKHKESKSDIFHCSGERGIKISLQLDLMAKNLLCEEYPEAKSVITKTKDNNIWLLNTEVYKIEGVARFYLGLAEHIKIIDAPALKEYTKNYIRNNFDVK